MKLPILYLIDSIVKNVGGVYIKYFSQSIVKIFIGAFEKVIIVCNMLHLNASTLHTDTQNTLVCNAIVVPIDFFPPSNLFVT